MRLVMATLLPEQVEAVRQALAEVQVTRLSIADAHGYARKAGGAAGSLSQLAVMEIAVNDDFLERTISTISGVMSLSGEHAGEAAVGTGLFVLPIAETVQIYRAVRGQEAI